MHHAERVFGAPAVRYLMDGMDDMDGMDGMDGMGRATARVAPIASGGMARTPCATFPRGGGAPALVPLGKKIPKRVSLFTFYILPFTFLHFLIPSYYI